MHSVFPLMLLKNQDKKIMHNQASMRCIINVMLLLGIVLLCTHCQADPSLKNQSNHSKSPPSSHKAESKPPHPSDDTISLVEITGSANPAFGPIRIVSSLRDIENWNKYCPDTTGKMTYHRPDFKGEETKCVAAKDITKSDALTIQKRNVIKNTILPGISAVIQSGPVTHNFGSPLRVPGEAVKKCSEFEIPSDHFRGVSDADVVMYVAAGPMKESEKGKLAWAIPCASLDGRTVAIAVNLNPSKIMETEAIIKAAAEEIQKVIGISKCPDDQAVLLKSNNKDGKLSTMCLSMKCEGNHPDQKIFYKDDSIWTECYDNDAVMSAGKKDEKRAPCPAVEDICNNPKLNKKLHPLSSNLKPMRIMASLMDLDDPKKYCPESNESKVPRPTFRGVTVNCLRANNEHFSEVLTDEKKKQLSQVIIPQLLASYATNPLIAPHDGPLRVPQLNSKSTCERFNIPAKDHTEGVKGADLVLYVAAGPMQASERNVSVWAEACQSMNGRVVAIAMNFNPGRIMNNVTTLEAAKKALSKALGTWKCPSTNAVLLDGTFEGEFIPGACVNVKCEAGGKVLVQRRGFGSWHECQEGNVLDHKVHPSLKKAFPPIACPKYEAVCSKNPSEMQSVSKIIGEFTDFPQTEKYTVRSGPQIRNLLKDGAEIIAPMAFATVIAAFFMVA